MRLAPRLALLLAVSLGACAPAGKMSSDPGETVEVQVTNRNRRDVTVYGVRSGQRTRLGTTPSGQTRTFALMNVRPGGLSDLRLSAEIIGSDEGYTSAPVAVVPGRWIYLVLEDLLSSSSVRVGVPSGSPEG